MPRARRRRGGAAGHGYVLDPPPRGSNLIPGSVAGSAGSCATGICFWFSQGCTIGCPKCGGTDGSATCGGQQGEATLPDSARSYTDSRACGTNPWCAPGSAPVMDPCGIAGGDVVTGKPGNGGVPPTAHKQGEKGSLLPELAGAKATWKAGGEANISWAVIANHGGGYQYRLCPKGASAPTEECFQQTPLEFVGDEYYIHYCEAPQQWPPYNGRPGAFDACGANITAYPATAVSSGTVPAGSTWRRNPIPACKAWFPNAGGAFGNICGPTGGSNPSDYQFTPAGRDPTRPGQLLGGFGAGGCYGQPYGRGCGTDGQNHKGGVPGTRNGVWLHAFHFNIVDTVRVPKVPPGDYVMSFRWDCEQTPQIWSTCSDVTITA